MNHYKSVGITGGIGSGKTYVCRILETMGYPVFYSDEAAKKIIRSHPKAIKALKALFGEQAYLKGEVNTTYLAEQIFSNPTLRKKMNAIIHPLVRGAFKDWAQKTNQPLVFNEAAILFETGAYKNFDSIILVYADEALRIKRIMERDKVTLEQIKSRMSAQWPDEEKEKLADFTIKNDGETALLPQINHILKQLK
ncbi:MAG: dephospho-CoA kinase [Crocinitomicaceae bacterium]